MHHPVDLIIARPHQGIAAVVPKPLTAIIVVSVSLATGYGASRVWPLPIISNSPLPRAAVMQAEPPEKNELSASVQPTPDASHLPSNQPATRNYSEGTIGVRLGAVTANSEANYRPASVEPYGVEQSEPKPNAQVGADQSSRIVRRRLIRAAAGRTLYGKRTAMSTIPQFAPNPRPDQAKDFLGSRVSRD